MGLSTTHGAFNGSYAALNNFRSILCKVVGGSFPPHFVGWPNVAGRLVRNMELDDSVWYWGDGCSKELNPGLFSLLSHNDYDGVLPFVECELIAGELEKLLPKISEYYKYSMGHIARDGGFSMVTKRFIKGCRKAYNRKQKITFR